MTKKLLYLGTDPSRYPSDKEIIHYPIIQINPKAIQEVEWAYQDIPLYTHWIFTSPNAVRVVYHHLQQLGKPFIPKMTQESAIRTSQSPANEIVNEGGSIAEIQPPSLTTHSRELSLRSNSRFLSHFRYKPKQCVAIGTGTQAILKELGVCSIVMPEYSTQEGVIELLNQWDLSESYLFLPQSSRARPCLRHYCMQRQLRCQLVAIYDTQVKLPDEPLELEAFDEIVFTSPSTVEAFITLFGILPSDKKLTAIGPITYKGMNYASTP